jgi:cell division protein FtsL
MKTSDATIRGQKRGDRHAREAARRHLRSDERGAGKVKAIIVTVLLVFAIYAAIKIVPPYAAEYQLADKIQEQARFAVVNHYTDEQIRENVFKVVQDLEIPAKREDIKIEASNRIVKIAMDYTVPIDLLSYHLDLHFTPSSENRSLF